MKILGPGLKYNSWNNITKFFVTRCTSQKHFKFIFECFYFSYTIAFESYEWLVRHLLWRVWVYWSCGVVKYNLCMCCNDTHTLSLDNDCDFLQFWSFNVIFLCSFIFSLSTSGIRVVVWLSRRVRSWCWIYVRMWVISNP